MKKLWSIILISMIGFNLQIMSSNRDSKKFDSSEHLGKVNQNVQLLHLSNNVLNQVKDNPKKIDERNAVIKKANADIVHLKRIRQHLQRLKLDENDIKNETRKEIKSYQVNKQNLIQSAQHDIDRLIQIEQHLIKLEDGDTTENEKAKASHRKSKEKTVELIQQKIDHLLKVERKLIVLTKNNPKEYREAEQIYYETEFLKGPELHDRETFSIEDAQYRDHLRKGISTYDSDIHGKLKNYLWGNT